jgi:uncharacterized protein
MRQRGLEMSGRPWTSGPLPAYDRAGMAVIGKTNSLKILHEAPQGIYLDGGERGEILLPRRYAPERYLPGDVLEVFVYFDSEDRLVATTEVPRVKVGEFACLEVVDEKGGVGAFLDWGLQKDLLLPLREQPERVHVGDWIVVYVFLDPRNERIVASMRLKTYLDLTPPEYAEGERVHLLVFEETPLGYNAIVNNAHTGLLYRSEVSAPLLYGQPVEGYVRAVRPDGKIDLRLDPAGYQRVAPLTEVILDALKKNGGQLEFDDNSSPDAIRQAFATSKKAFKQALGALLRQRRIEFTKPGIRLVG